MESIENKFKNLTVRTVYCLTRGGGQKSIRDSTLRIRSDCINRPDPVSAGTSDAREKDRNDDVERSKRANGEKRFINRTTVEKKKKKKKSTYNIRAERTTQEQRRFSRRVRRICRRHTFLAPRAHETTALDRVGSIGRLYTVNPGGGGGGGGCSRTCLSGEHTPAALRSDLLGTRGDPAALRSDLPGTRGDLPGDADGENLASLTRATDAVGFLFAAGLQHAAKP